MSVHGWIGVACTLAAKLSGNAPRRVHALIVHVVPLWHVPALRCHMPYATPLVTKVTATCINKYVDLKGFAQFNGTKHGNKGTRHHNVEESTPSTSYGLHT